MRLAQAAGRRAAYLPEGGNQFSEWYAQTYDKPTEELARPLFESFAQTAFAGNSVVYACMLARASLFSEATFKYRRQADKGLFGTADLLPLEAPWPGGTTAELLVRMIQDADLAGNSFIRRDPDRLVRLRPDWTDIVRVGVDAGDGVNKRSRWDVAGYVYHTSGPGSACEFYSVDEVSHWSPMPDPLATFRGMSWLTPVVREINSDIAMTAYKRQFMDNSATPNLLVKYQQKLSPQSLDKVRQTWNARYGGPGGMKTAILDSGADVSVIGNTMEAMSFTDVQAAGEARIASASGVPPLIAGLSAGLETANYAVYSMTMRRFADITMRPLWRGACGAVAKLVSPQDGATLWYDTADIAALQAGEQERAGVMTTQAGTINTLITAGFTADSAVSAVVAGDMTLLRHSGLVSVQLQPPGTSGGAA